MSNLPPPPPSFPSQRSAQPGLISAAAVPSATVVEVVARRSGVSQAIFFVLTLVIIAVVFVVGLSVGAVAGLAGGQARTTVLETPFRPSTGQRVAILGVEGPVSESMAEDVRLAVEHVLADGTFRAVVLRVNSPGGAVSPSDRIWREIERLKQAGLPVVASYGGIAASGGVFVSCGADEITCELTGITGAVGVIASVLTFGDLMDKVGVEPVTMVATGSPRKSDANDMYRKWTTTDRAVLQGIIDQSYDIFVSRVVAGRAGKASDAAALRASLDGRVMTADAAKAVGLIDSIGYLDDAITIAERRAGLPVGSSDVVRIIRPRTFWAESLMGEFAGLVHLRETSEIRVNGDSLRDALNDLSRPRIEYVFR